MTSLERWWYKKKSFLSSMLYPVHFIFWLLIGIRKFLYKTSIFSSIKTAAKVIVVGNITVGGTGKSPLVMHLAKELSDEGYKVGILSRGYGGKAPYYPFIVEADSDVSETGDEPLMIRNRNNIPVVVDPKRSRGANFLHSEFGCDVIISDDGLQHYALQRDIELVVVDGERLFGNELLLPVGPLREPLSRLQEVDAVIYNQNTKKQGERSEFQMALIPLTFKSLNENTKSLTIDEFMHYIQDFDEVHAVAAIGNPERFFNQLKDFGLESVNHDFEDHHSFNKQDFDGMKGLIIMTEKDAVKCRNFSDERMWFLQVEAELTGSLSKFCMKKLKLRV